MKKRRFRVCCFLLAAALAVLPLMTAAGAADEQPLQFHEGKFKILVFSDCQDVVFASPRMLAFMEYAVETEQPDFVVYNGDNVVEPGYAMNKAAIRQILTPCLDRNIPYGYVYGNHDGEYFPKEQMDEFYHQLGDCRTYDAAPELTGFGNCQVPILSSDGEQTVFRLWFFDSGSENENGYDHVHEDQLNWFLSESEALSEQDGSVPALLFQHIPLPETVNLLKEVPEGTEGARNYYGKYYLKELNDSADGHIGEWICPSAENHGEFQILKQQGDVQAIVTGHDHSNSFIGTYDGIDFLQTPAVSARSGDSEIRGCRIIELDEATGGYTTRILRSADAPQSIDSLAGFSAYKMAEQIGYILKYAFDALTGVLARIRSLG